VNVIEENPRIEDWLNHREYRLKKLLPQMYTVQGFLSVILRFSPPAAVIKEDLRAMSLDETIAAIARLFSDKRDSGR